MKKGNMTILASILAIMLVAIGVGAGTMAYFSDTETAGPNLIMAGNIDLELECVFELTDIFPSKELDPITFIFQNVGSIPGYLYYKVTYTDSNTGGDLSADNFAALIYVESLTFQLYSWPVYQGWGGISNDIAGLEALDELYGNNDDYCSLYEMKEYGWMEYDSTDPKDPLLVGERAKYVITLHMADSLVAWPDGDLLFDVEDNRPQDDGIDVTFTAILRSSEISP